MLDRKKKSSLNQTALYSLAEVFSQKQYRIILHSCNGLQCIDVLFLNTVTLKKGNSMIVFEECLMEEIRVDFFLHDPPAALFKIVLNNSGNHQIIVTGKISGLKLKMGKKNL